MSLPGMLSHQKREVESTKKKNEKFNGTETEYIDPKSKKRVESAKRGN